MQFSGSKWSEKQTTLGLFSAVRHLCHLISAQGKDHDMHLNVTILK